MSDITRPGRKPGARICVFANEIKAQHQAGGAVWWSQTGSNRRPPACKAGALPTELWPLASGVLVSGLHCWLAEPQLPAARIAAFADATARQPSLAARAKAGGPGKI